MAGVFFWRPIHGGESHELHELSRIKNFVFIRVIRGHLILSGHLQRLAV